MVRTASIFSQLLRFFPSNEFSTLVAKHGAERAAKGFSSWAQLVSMLFCHLAGAESLREICTGLACCLGKLRHLGLSASPNKSTLSYANAHRPAAMFEELFWQTLERFRSLGQMGPSKHGFRFKNKLLSLDSTVISLCLTMFPWARYRTAKGGVKAHVLLSHNDYLPSYVCITEARKADVKIAQLLDLTAGSIVAMDRAYNDFALFERWTARGVFFVTRLKSNTVFEVVEEREPPQNRNIVLDQVIRLTGDAGTACPSLLRVVVAWDAENDRYIELLTNHLDFGATTISAIYKDRWQIELFFKALKQNLKVKTFVGTSENALRIQIWTALISILLLRWMAHQSRSGWSLSLMAAAVRWNLFVYRDLQEWLTDPYAWDADPPPIAQLCLSIPGVGQHFSRHSH
ncbi:MAG: IS4 family transposase [Phycisphaerae bacterium]|nr:IS4 family transposase [Phycisphaerae bacterium]